MKAFIVAVAAAAALAMPALAAETMTREAQGAPSMRTAQDAPAYAPATRDAQPMADGQAMTAPRAAAPMRATRPVVGL